MNPEMRIKVFDMYEDEIERKTMPDDLVMALILYKSLGNIDSYRFEDTPLSFLHIKDDSKPSVDSMKNIIIFGGVPYLNNKYIDELSTAFINTVLSDNNGNSKYTIFIDDKNRIVHITGKNIDESVTLFSFTRTFLSIITKLMPWYFGDMPIEIVEEFALIFTNQSAENLDEKFEKFVTDSGIYDDIIIEQVRCLGEKVLESKKAELERSIRSESQFIETILAQLYERNQKLRQYRATLNGINMGCGEFSEPINELLEFMKTLTEDVRIVDVKDSSIICFECRTLLEYYDEYESSIKNNTGASLLLSRVHGSNDYTINQKKRFYEELIEKQSIKIYTHCNISLNVVNGEVGCEKTHVEKKNAMPHPHLAEFSCFGDATYTITELTLMNRYAEVLNQIVYSSKQFTLGDESAAGRFVNSILNYHCILCPDGEYRNFDDTMKYLIQEGIIDAE